MKKENEERKGMPDVRFACLQKPLDLDWQLTWQGDVVGREVVALTKIQPITLKNSPIPGMHTHTHTHTHGIYCAPYANWTTIWINIKKIISCQNI